jgi:hypothetical protein
VNISREKKFVGPKGLGNARQDPHVFHEHGGPARLFVPHELRAFRDQRHSEVAVRHLLFVDPVQECFELGMDDRGDAEGERDRLDRDVVVSRADAAAREDDVVAVGEHAYLSR